jgi:hypothetical protein
MILPAIRDRAQCLAKVVNSSARAKPTGRYGHISRTQAKRQRQISAFINIIKTGLAILARGWDDRTSWIAF